VQVLKIPEFKPHSHQKPKQNTKWIMSVIPGTQ
jgi:hypothetical protein